MSIAKFPVINSLGGAALGMMLKGEKISHLDFMCDTWSYCLRHPIYLLRQNGWPISDEVRQGGISRYSGRQTYYKVYFIHPLALIILQVELGERLDKFSLAIAQFEQRLSDEH